LIQSLTQVDNTIKDKTGLFLNLKVSSSPNNSQKLFFEY